MARSSSLLPKRPFLGSLFGSLVAALGATPHAAAQSAGYAVNRFEPSERGSDWFVGESLDLRGRARPLAGIVMDWAYNPLVLRPGPGRPAAKVITDDVVMHVGGGVVFADRLRAALSVPVALYRHGEDVSAASTFVRAPAQKAAVSDLRIGFDALLLGSYGGIARLAIGTQVHLPTGSREAFTSDGTIRVAPRILVAGDGSAFAYAAKVGFAYRPYDGIFEGRHLGSEAFFSLSGGVKVNDRVVFGPELHGATVVTGDDAFASRGASLGGLLGMRVILFDDFRIGNAVGTGFGRGDGSPDFRLLASFEYAPDVCVDKDGDGICAKEDACPLVAGVRTGVRSTNGCPQAGPSPTDDGPRPEPSTEPPPPEEGPPPGANPPGGVPPPGGPPPSQ